MLDRSQWIAIGLVSGFAYILGKDRESFEAPYSGSGSLMGIKQDTSIGDFSTKELTESSAIHGDFNEASLNYSGHQNIQVRGAESFEAEKKNCGCGQDPCVTYGAEPCESESFEAKDSEKMEVTFKIQDADYATFYYTTDIPSELGSQSDEDIVSYVWGDECEPQDDNWFYCPYDWDGVGEHYLAKVMNKALKAESFEAEILKQNIIPKRLEGKRVFVVSSVDYETDGEDIDLPQNFTFILDEDDTELLDGSTDMQEIADLLVDNISDETGWLVQGFYFQERMPDGTLVDLDAESFEAYGHKGLIKLYGISGDAKIQSTVERILADINEGQGFADDEYYYLTEEERDEAYDDMEFDAESFEAESFEDFKRILVGDRAIAGDMGYMEGLEEYYNEYLEDFTGDNPESFEDFQERILREYYETIYPHLTE